MKNTALLCLSAGVALCAARAADVYDATTGYVTLLGDDTDSVRSLAAAGNWSDLREPHADTNYYVKSGWTAQGPSASFSFPATLVAAGDVRCRGGNSTTGTFADLKILAGGGIKFTDLEKVAGKITFLSEDAENPSLLKYGLNSFNYANLAAEVIGSKSSQVYFYLYIPSYKYPGYLLLGSGSDWTKFLGTLRFADKFGMKVPTGVTFSSPGRFAFGSNAWLQVLTNSSFGDLSFASDSTLTNSAQVNVSGTLNTGANFEWQSQNGNSRVSTVGTLRVGDGSYLCFAKGSSLPESFYVTNRLQIGSGVRMLYKVDSTPAAGGAPAEYPMFRLSPEAVAAGLPGFAGVNVSMNTFMDSLPTIVVDVRDDPVAAGGKYVYLTHREVVSYCGGDQMAEANLTMDTDVDQTGVWTDNLWPHSDADYYVGRNDARSITSGSLAFRAPTVEHPNRVTTFPSGKLSVGASGTIYLYTSACVSNLHTFSSVIYPRASCHLSGKWMLHRYPSAGYETTVRMYNDAIFCVDSQVAGNGDIVAESYYPNSAGSTLFLAAINTNWTGGIVTKWTQNPNSPLSVSENAHTRIVVGDGRSLGGAMPAFRHESLELKDYAELRVTNSAEFAETTRGILVLDNGCINIDDGMRVALDAPLTLHGTLRKTGGGVLSLGGALRFGQNDDLDDATAPAAGLNAIMVKAGALKVVNANALDGAAVDFAAGTSLRLDLHPADVEMQSKGFAFANASSALACTGKIPVVFEGGNADEYNSGVVAPLCTVASGSAATTMAKLNPRMAVASGTRAGVLSSVDNGDGTATIFANFKAKGFTLIYR